MARISSDRSCSRPRRPRPAAALPRGPACRRAAGAIGAVGAAVEIFGWMRRHPEQPLSRALARPGQSCSHASRRSSLPPLSSRWPKRRWPRVSAPSRTPPSVPDEAAATRDPRARVCRARGFGSPGQGEDGALLHVLAARRGITRAAEIGTGAGVGAAWIVSALRPATLLLHRPARSGTCRRDRDALRRRSERRHPHRDWRETLPPRPLSTCCSAAGDAKDDVDAAIGLLAPGGTAVLDDFRPDPAAPDLGRNAWLEHPLPTAVELWVTPRRRAIVAVRR